MLRKNSLGIRINDFPYSRTESMADHQFHEDQSLSIFPPTHTTFLNLDVTPV